MIVHNSLIVFRLENYCACKERRNFDANSRRAMGEKTSWAPAGVFGFAAGVGKTYGMLAEAHELLLMGKNVVIGYIEPHDRPDTNRLVEGLPQIPPKKFSISKWF